ncbi:hypothetical protein C8F04DRAFT_1176826 [Mycena alexandri]|uniref:Uncharacterized protein n=1 Tax=Mycena alexandri TaxID=1745969 RepID=A0AAD6XAX7_9AGAR|nr:hypothetical protein C8F04DRAFT_1176826 [Mycena alexandri]
MHHPLQTILLLSLALAGNLSSTGPSQDLCAQDSNPGGNLWGKGVCKEEIGSLTNFLPLTTVTTSPAPGPIATASPNTARGFTGFHIVSHRQPPACSGGIISLSTVLWGYGPFGQGLVPHALRGIVLGFEGSVPHAHREFCHVIIIGHANFEHEQTADNSEQNNFRVRTIGDGKSRGRGDTDAAGDKVSDDASIEMNSGDEFRA